MYMTTKASYTSVPSKSILTPLLLAFLPSLSEKGSQVLHSSWRWGETFLSAVLTLAQSPIPFLGGAHRVLASL